MTFDRDNELGEVALADDPAELLLGGKHAGGGPELAHVARKLVYLAIQNAAPQWTRTREWTKALLAFKIQFGDRLPD